MTLATEIFEISSHFLYKAYNYTQDPKYHFSNYFCALIHILVVQIRITSMK